MTSVRKGNFYSGRYSYYGPHMNERWSGRKVEPTDSECFHWP